VSAVRGRSDLNVRISLVRMTYIKVVDFEIRKVPLENQSDIINLEIYINESNFFVFPVYIRKMEEEIEDKLKKVLEGKDVVIDLSLDDDSDRSSKLFQITKEYSLINIINRNEKDYREEIYLKAENNTIFRNGIRKFIN
jgi:hypothetical protein